MSAPDIPLSRAEVIWAEILKGIQQAQDLTRELNAAEHRIETSVTTLEVTLSDIDEKVRLMEAEGDNMVDQRTAAIRAEIEGAKERLMIELQRRDLAVQEGIVTAVNSRITDLLTDIRATISTQVTQEIGKSAAAARKSWQDSGRGKWLSIAVVCVLVACFLSAAVAGAWAWRTGRAGMESSVATLVRSGGNGSAALDLATLNNLGEMMDCKGFRRMEEAGKVYCLPMAEDGRVYGWRIK